MTIITKSAMHTAHDHNSQLKMEHLANTNDSSNLFDIFNILMLNCLVLSGPIVSEGLRKSSPNVTIFSAKFQSQFDSL